MQIKWLVAVSLWCGVASYAAILPELSLEKKLLERIQGVDRAMDGVIGVAIIDLTSGRLLQHNGDTVFPQASSIKIPIMIEVFRQVAEGRVKLEERITLQPGESVGGSGHLGILLRSGPVTQTVRELITAMIETSDNTATNRLIALVGMDSINRWLGSAGLHQTKLQRRMLEPGAAAANRENISTPIEMARIAELLYPRQSHQPESLGGDDRHHETTAGGLPCLHSYVCLRGGKTRRTHGSPGRDGNRLRRQAAVCPERHVHLPEFG
jgi:beta-lactamase class A